MKGFNKIKLVLMFLTVIPVVNSTLLSAQDRAEVPKRIQKQFEKARELYMGLEWELAEAQLKEILKI